MAWGARRLRQGWHSQETVFITNRLQQPGQRRENEDGQGRTRGTESGVTLQQGLDRGAKGTGAAICRADVAVKKIARSSQG